MHPRFADVALECLSGPKCAPKVPREHGPPTGARGQGQTTAASRKRRRMREPTGDGSLAWAWQRAWWSSGFGVGGVRQRRAPSGAITPRIDGSGGSREDEALADRGFGRQSRPGHFGRTRRARPRAPSDPRLGRGSFRLPFDPRRRYRRPECGPASRNPWRWQRRRWKASGSPSEPARER